MMARKYRQTTVLVWTMAAILLFHACKPSVPKEYIQPDVMEDILFDYYLADGLSACKSTSSYENRAVENLTYRDAVLKKYGENRARFDSSMVYYYRHTERLHDIYKRLAQRLSDEANALGGQTQSGYASLEVRGDTADVWNGPRAVALLPFAPENRLSFEVKADTSFHAGDIVSLGFNTRFIFQEGMKEAVAVMAVRLANDSIVVRNMTISGSSHYTLRLEDINRIGIKEIKGMFVMPRRLSDPSQSYKLAVLSDIRLVKIHVKNRLRSETSKPDSVSSGNARRIPSTGLRTPDGARPEPQMQLDKPLEMQMNDVNPEPRRSRNDRPEVLR